MIEIHPSQLSQSILDLFTLAEPAGFRMLGVLDGILPGRIFADCIPDPNWAVVQERLYGTLYWGGDVQMVDLGFLVDALLADGDVLLGMWLEDPRWDLVPPKPDYEGAVLDFYDRPPGSGLGDYLNAVPQGFDIRTVDQELFERSKKHQQHMAGFRSLAEALDHLLGYYLMHGEEIVCEAFAGPVVRSTRELGVETYDNHRRRGYATFTCAHLVHACETAGYATWWNCNRVNTASAALARKLGYRVEKTYKLVAWFKDHHP